MTYNFSENIQKGIIYLCKADISFFSQISALIKPEYFEFPSYSLIFKSIRDYYDEYKKLPSDDVLLESIKKVMPQNEVISTYEDDIIQINNMDKSVVEDRDFIFDLIEDYAKKMAVTQAIKDSVILLKEQKFAEIEEKIREAMIVNRTVDVGLSYFDQVEERYNRQFESVETRRFKTVFNTCNDFLDGGLCKKEIAMVVAPPGVGKSLYLVNQGAESMRQGKKVLYISLEMSQDKIAQRFDSILTLIPNFRLKMKDSVPVLKERLKVVTSKYNGSELFIKEFPAGTLNVNQVRALLVQLELHHNFVPDVMIVDYLELMRPARNIDSEYAAQERIAQELRGLAMEKNMLVWTATQTNRMGKKVGLITDSELGDSYGKIRPMDWAISLNQTQEEYDKGRMRVYVVKARDSKQHYTIPASVNYSNLVISELPKEQENYESISS